MSVLIILDSCGATFFELGVCNWCIPSSLMMIMLFFIKYMEIVHNIFIISPCVSVRHTLWIYHSFMCWVSVTFPVDCVLPNLVIIMISHRIT